MKRTTIAALLACVSLASLALPATAGGWALAELVTDPGTVSIGEAVTIDIALLQHGETPMNGGTPLLTAIHQVSEEQVTAEGRLINAEDGTYRFSVRFPAAGAWKWWVSHDPLPGLTTFPTLLVGEAAAAATPPATDEAAVTIAIASMVFQPIRLEIAAGTTVKWVNGDVIPHQISAIDTLWFDDSPLLQPGESYSFTFEQPGTFDYGCGPHVTMTGRIVVT